MLICLSFAVTSARAADVRYEVVHLQVAYGEEWFFTGMSPGGVLTATSPTGIATVVGTDFQSFAYPFQNSTFLSTFGDSELMYVERLGTPENPTLEGIFSIDRSGNVANTGYSPRGTGMSLGPQNSLGTVIGRETGIPGSAGFIYSSGTGGQSVETLGGVEVTRFSAINNNGWIVGNGIASTASGDVSGMFLWVPGEDGLLLAPGFGTPEGINDFGQIIGAQGAGAFFWDEGDLQFISDVYSPDPRDPEQMINLTVLGGAFGINNHGEVTGFSTIRPEFGYEGPTGLNGWLWTEDEGLQFLDDLVEPVNDFHFTGGLAIAEDGSILTAGFVGESDVVQHFLLTPIPEPGSIFLLGLGMVALAIRRWR